MWNQSMDRPWLALLVVGSLIVTALVLFQGMLLAAPPVVASQDEERRLEDRGPRVWSGMRGSRIGVSIDDLESSEMDGSITEGAVVRSVNGGSPAADAGFAEGDLVVEFDAERVRSARQLSRLVQETPVGREISVVVMRDDTRVTLRVTLKEGPGFSAAVREWIPDFGRLEQRLSQAVPQMPRLDLHFDLEGRLVGGRRRLGIGVTQVGPQLAEYFGVDHGVLVTTVAPESVASTAGLQAGDVLTAIAGQPVDDVGTLHRILAAIEPLATFQIEVSRDGDMVMLEGRFEDNPRLTRRVPRRI